MLVSNFRKEMKNILAVLSKSVSLIKKLIDKNLYPLLNIKSLAKI